MKEKTISKEKLLNILKYVGIALAALLALGLIGSLFAGNDDDDGGVRLPSVNRPSIEAPEGTEGSTDSSTEAPEIPVIPEDPSIPTKAAVDESKFNVYVTPDDLSAILDFNLLGKKLASGAGDHEVMTDTNGTSFLRIYGDGSSPEAYASIQNIEGKTTGKYLVFAYRVPETTYMTANYLQIYANTVDESVTGKGDMFYVNVEKDGQWHVCVVDIENAIASSPSVLNGNASRFVANADGTYTINKLRIDWFNEMIPTTDHIDVAYVAICDDLGKARAADTDYTGAEFTAEDLSKLASFSDTLYEVNGMKYAKLEANTSSGGEISTYLHNSDSLLNGASRYLAVMYRNAPDQYLEVHINSTIELTASGFYSRGVSYYELDSRWHLAIIDLSNYSDTVCRSLRVDFVNQNGSSMPVSMDVAFVKFFSNEEEARAYYQDYVDTYDLNAVNYIEFFIDGRSFTAVEGMTWAEWCESEFNTLNANCGSIDVYVLGGIIVGVSANEEIKDLSIYELYMYPEI